MSDDDDDDDDDRIGEAHTSPCTITVKGLATEKLMANVIERVEATFAQDISNRAAQQLRKSIDHKVTEAVERITKDELDAQIRKAIVEGWQETDRWGNPSGKRITLSMAILAHLSETVDSYGRTDRSSSATTTRVRFILAEEVAKVFKTEIGPSVEEFKAVLRGMFDAELKSKLALALKEAFKV